MVKDKELTIETQKDLRKMLDRKMTAFNMLVDNYNREGDSDYDTNKIVNRLQTQYFALDRDEDKIRTAEDWSQNEYNEPNEVNYSLYPVVDGKYSSFALKDVSEELELTYPLDDDYSALVRPFSNKNISDSEYEAHLRVLEEKLGVRVEQNDVYTTSTYKRNFGKMAFLKIKDVALKLLKKPVEVSAVYSGKISLQSKVDGYQISNIEKITKVYDFIFKVSIAKVAKEYKKETGKKVSKEVQYAARLFADILMSRINDFNAEENHKMLEKCLWLQFANFANRHNFDAKQLALITKLGTGAVVETCKEIGITREKIIEKMLKHGFVYKCMPADEAQALLAVTEKDFARYTENYAENNETEDKDKDTEAGLIAETVVENTETTKEETVEQTALTETEKPVENTETSVVNSTQETTKIKKSAVEKVVDKAIVKFVSKQGNAISDKIEAGKFKGKKLEVAKAQLRYYNLILSYYVQASNGRPMSIKNNDDYTPTEITKAKAIVKGLLERREALVQEALNSTINRPEGQKPLTYVNAVCVQATKHTVLDYFTKLIKGCVEYCLSEQFGRKNEQSAKVDPLLVGGVELVETKTEGENKETNASETEMASVEEHQTVQEENVEPTQLEFEEVTRIFGPLPTEEKDLEPVQLEIPEVAELDKENNSEKEETSTTESTDTNFVMLDENGKEIKPYVPNFIFVEDKGIER